MSLPLPILSRPTRVYPRIPKSRSIIEQHPPYSLILDGITGSGSIPDAPSQRGMAALSLQVWWKAKAWTPQYYAIIAKFPYSGQRYYMLGYVTGGQLYFYIHDNGSGQQGLGLANPTPNIWHNIACLFQGSAYMSIFLDSVQKSSAGTSLTSINNSSSGSQPLALGHYDTYYANGAIGGVLIYNRALSPAEIHFNMRNPMTPILNGLVLFLPLIEGSGLSVKDYSGQNNNVALNSTGVQWNNLALDEMLADVV